jgi:polar amino acid transport system substrate-binding protein
MLKILLFSICTLLVGARIWTTVDGALINNNNFPSFEKITGSANPNTSKKKVIYVGGYEFAPFVSLDNNNQAHGITKDLIHALNTVQKEYDFKFFLTTPEKRYEQFKQGKFDLMLFESKRWGWKDTETNFSKVYLNGGEVYIALSDVKKSNTYFDNFEGKRLAIMRGFHYGFADFNSNEKFLVANYNAVIVNSNASIFNMLLTGNADIGVITMSYIDLYFKNHPKLKSKFLTSNKLDQVYNHTILVREKTSPTVKEVNNLLSKLKRDGLLQKTWKKYGLSMSRF